MGHWCDGRASMVVGTHTHVPTADAQILNGGTAFQSDAGMCGDYDSVIGMDKLEPMRRFVTGMGKERFSPAEGAATLSGLFVETDDKTGRALKVRMIRIGGRLEEATAVRARLPWIGVLLLLGTGWGSTQALGKIAVSGGHGPLLLIFWQTCIVVVVLGGGAGAAPSPPGTDQRGGVAHLHADCALTGTIIPNLSFLSCGGPSAGGGHVDPYCHDPVDILPDCPAVGGGPLHNGAADGAFVRAGRGCADRIAEGQPA